MLFRDVSAYCREVSAYFREISEYFRWEVVPRTSNKLAKFGAIMATGGLE